MYRIHAPSPAKVTLERITEDREELYRAAPLPGETIVPPSPIDDYVPTYEEVEWVVRRLRGHRLVGPSRMRTEHLREWLREHRASEVAAEAEMETEAEAPLLTLYVPSATPGGAQRASVRGLPIVVPVVSLPSTRPPPL